MRMVKVNSVYTYSMRGVKLLFTQIVNAQRWHGQKQSLTFTKDTCPMMFTKKREPNFPKLNFSI